MDELLDYQYDNCYYLNPTFNSNNEESFDKFLSNNFIKTDKITLNPDDSFRQCKNEAKNNHKDFFLVSNLTNDVNDSNVLKYNCYIPNVDSSFNFSNIKSIVDPFNGILENLLGNTNVRKTVNRDTDFFDLTSNNYQEDILTDVSVKNKFDNAKCFSYKDNSSLNFGKKDTKYEKNTTFALYKTDLIFNDDVNNVFNNNKYNNLYTNYKIHKTNFQNNFVKQDFEYLIENIKNKLNNYLCDEIRKSLDNVKEKAFDDSLSSLGNYYSTMFSNLDDLSKDISNVYVIAKYDLYRLSHLERKILEEKKKLRNLLGFDAGSNGKLFDTKYLKNVKLSETIILSLIIIFLIYFYAKKK